MLSIKETLVLGLDIFLPNCKRRSRLLGSHEAVAGNPFQGTQHRGDF